MIKINIYFNTLNKAWGGGNQFLKALKKYLVAKGVYEESPRAADVIIFNSHQLIGDIVKLKYKYPNKIFIHRVDGPMTYYRDDGIKLDRMIFKINNMVADGTVFQSNYSKYSCYELGMNKDVTNAVIMNAPDPIIFNKINKEAFSRKRKIRLISTSWSDNWKKGFDVLKFLDENLDFSKFDMTFIGNTPVDFKNIRHIQPLASEELSLYLKKSDIFIFTSKIESCSNSLLEGGHCGLPMVAYNSTGNPEVVKGGGALFKSKLELPGLIDEIADHYDHYVDKIILPDIVDIGQTYYDFCKSLHDSKNSAPIKKINTMYFLLFKLYLFLIRVRDKLISII
jgi:glycosyltransferase involved in cell wall biosynthesis